ncbi:MAG: glycosyl hydrolase family 2, partial [Prolixibacteraceae bacterium]|nr:glycosyl hydrolase family 2 [Prolixibacteraceae bacterium]
MKKFILWAAILTLVACSGEKPELKLPSLVSDHMVLQQNTTVNFWGWNTPGKEVTVVCDWGAEATSTTDANGKWQLQLETPAFGGPYNVSVSSGKTKIEISDVLIGEVWICSGQSNMEMPLKGWPPNDTIEGSAKAIAHSANDQLRMFTVTRRVAMSPADDCIGRWELSHPETAGNFSATAYFFGKQLQETLGIPVGLIHSSWGGTVAEAWTSLQEVSTVEGFEDFAERAENARADYQKYQVFLSKLEKIPFSSLPLDQPFANLNLNDSAYVNPSTDLSTWKTLEVPGLWETSVLPGFDGVVWVQKDFEYDGTVYPEGLELYLGPIDDMDATYLNGVKLGSNEKAGVYQLERSYAIPQGLLREGMNRVAVKITDTGGGGGIYGFNAPAIVKAGERLLDLGGTWNYQPIAIFNDQNLVVFAEGELSYDAMPKLSVSFDQNTPTVLYNGMIHPLLPYAIKGAIWYQGESNVGRGAQYESLFPTMISNWRIDWQQGAFPFYFVQISPYDYGTDADESVSALRFAQFKTLELENTGMVVTMDIGNPKNIHPANKNDVGKRLALWALSKTYQQEGIVCSGPLFKQAEFNKQKVEIQFDYAENGLVMSDGKSYFEIAGNDGVFYPAKAEIKGSVVVLSSPKVKDAASVRYAW